MSTETQIQTEVEALKAQFSDTKALYREVCALLFFRYGITPTVSKLYQFVRKGSMSAPADALTKFWDELRSKARIEIDHPDLPDDVKQATANAIATIWRQATTLARDELTALRLEVAGHLETAQNERSTAVREAQQLRHQIDTLQAQIAQSKIAADAVQAELEAERRAHATTAARHLEVQRGSDELRAQIDRQRADFSAELARARSSVDQANERADGAERRALLEIDQERQARSKAEKAAEGLRSQLSNAEAAHREAETAAAREITRLNSALEASEQGRASLAAAKDSLASELDTSRLDLAKSREGLARAEAEARTVQAVLDRFGTPSPAVATATPTPTARDRRKK